MLNHSSNRSKNSICCKSAQYKIEEDLLLNAMRYSIDQMGYLRDDINIFMYKTLNLRVEGT
jgi:hypothetical protein